MSLSFVLTSPPDERAVVVAQGTAESAPEVLRSLFEMRGFREAAGVLLGDGSLPAAFFDLKSGFAGEVLQKFVNYGVRAAIVLPAGGLPERLVELAREHQTHASIRFFTTEGEALRWLRHA